MKEKNGVVIALSGPIAAGKSTVASILNKKFGFNVIKTRDILGQYIEAQGEAIDDHALQAYGGRIMDGKDARMFCDMIIKQMSIGANYVIDSLRPIFHYDYLSTLIDNFHLMYISAPQDLRERRYLHRGGKRESTRAGFFYRETHPVESEVRDLLDFADVVIVNKDKDKLERQLFSSVIPLMYTDRPLYFQEMLWAVDEFHKRHGYNVRAGNAEVMSIRVGLMIEELGAIHACISKGKTGIDVEHADLLYLLLGNCITLGFDLENAFLMKYTGDQNHCSKEVEEDYRVSERDDQEE